MWKHRMCFLGWAASILLTCGQGVVADTWWLKDGEKWKAVEADPQEKYVHALAELKKLVQTGDAKAVKDALEQLKEEFPDRVGPDLDLFIGGELRYWQDRYNKAMTQFEKLLEDYPGSDFAAAALEREFAMGRDYLNGRKISVLGLFKIAGYAEGVEIMERISDRAGLDEPNGVGLRAAIAVAEHFEIKEDYLEAHLKWAEIASYWETGAVGRRALYRMAENNLAAYNEPRPERRHHYDASKLTTARAYYEKFLLLYPKEGKEKGIPGKIEQIDEQMAYKQFTIGQYYRRTGESRAANLYFDMVVRNWPGTAAAALARDALEQSLDSDPTDGK